MQPVSSTSSCTSTVNIPGTFAGLQAIQLSCELSSFLSHILRRKEVEKKLTWPAAKRPVESEKQVGEQQSSHSGGQYKKNSAAVIFLSRSSLFRCELRTKKSIYIFFCKISTLFYDIHLLTPCLLPLQVPARVALGVTTLLAMSTTQASINSSLPPVAYTKAIDVWSGVCVTYVFGALLEYALVNYASR